LSHTDRFDHHYLLAKRVQQISSFIDFTGQPSQTSPGSHTADKYTWVAAQVAHADAIPQDRAAAERAGVYRNHRDGRLRTRGMSALAPKVPRQTIDEGRLARAVLAYQSHDTLGKFDTHLTENELIGIGIVEADSIQTNLRLKS